MAIGQFSSKLLVFLLLPLYTSLLLPEEYGVFDLLVTSVTLLTPIFTLTVAESVLRFCLDNNYDERKGILKSVHNYWERCIQAEKQKQLYRFDRNLNYFYTD